MNPINFSKSNYVVVGGLGGHSANSGIHNIPAYRDGDEILSCWRPSWRERIAILLRGKVWLLVTANTHPPVAVDGGRVFERD